MKPCRPTSYTCTINGEAIIIDTVGSWKQSIGVLVLAYIYEYGSGQSKIGRYLHIAIPITPTSELKGEGITKQLKRLLQTCCGKRGGGLLGGTIVVFRREGPRPGSFTPIGFHSSFFTAAFNINITH